MFGPRCCSRQSDELNFWKVCGTNLSAVLHAVDTRKTDEKVDWNKPWYAEMALSEAESKRRKEELDHRRGIAPEVTRYNEIKGGIITGSVGIGVGMFLYFFMQRLILRGEVSPDTSGILNALWIDCLI